jgi:hypothetical protein
MSACIECGGEVGFKGAFGVCQACINRKEILNTAKEQLEFDKEQAQQNRADARNREREAEWREQEEEYRNEATREREQFTSEYTKITASQIKSVYADIVLLMETTDKESFKSEILNMLQNSDDFKQLCVFEFTGAEFDDTNPGRQLADSIPIAFKNMFSDSIIANPNKAELIKIAKEACEFTKMSKKKEFDVVRQKIREKKAQEEQIEIERTKLEHETQQAVEKTQQAAKRKTNQKILVGIAIALVCQLGYWGWMKKVTKAEIAEQDISAKQINMSAESPSLVQSVPTAI